MRNSGNNDFMTFGGHLDVMRKMLFRITFMAILFTIVIFCAKDTTFNLLLAPCNNSFATYKVIEHLAKECGVSFHFAPYHIQLINTELSSQFMVHISTSFYIALLFTSPYIVVELYKFIAPALYDNERRYSVIITIAIYFLFMIGVLMSYFIIFPFAVRFLGTYQVMPNVENQINISSYISTFTTLTILMGAVFQIPVISFFLAKVGVLEVRFMKKYRRHAFIIIAIIAAIITPPDIFTCCLVCLPMYGLYEISIIIVSKICKK